MMFSLCSPNSTSAPMMAAMVARPTTGVTTATAWAARLAAAASRVPLEY